MTHRGIAIGFAPVLSHVVAAARVGAQTLEELRGRYQWGALYITSSALVDFSYLAKSSKGSASENRVGLPLLAAFITQVGQSRISNHIAVLHLDLQQLRAGYMPAGGSLGVLTAVPWTSEQIVEVARWVDAYYRRNHSRTTVMSRLPTRGPATGGGGDQLGLADIAAIRTAMDAVQEMAEDPFISPVRALQLTTQLRAWMATNAAVLSDLHGKDQVLFNDLSAFQWRYDVANYTPGRAELLSPFTQQSQHLGRLDDVWLQPFEFGADLSVSLLRVEAVLRDVRRRQ